MFKYIFPRTNELAVFVITTVLYALVCFIPEVRNSVIGFFHALWLAWVSDFHGAPGVWQPTKLLLGLIFFTLLGLFYTIGPLLLPFTKRDIRVAALVILWVDAVLLIYWQVVGSDGPSLLRLAVTAYTAAWLIYSVILIRVRQEQGIVDLVDDTQVTPRLALVVASTGAIGALALVVFFKAWWLDAYMLSVFLCLIAERLWGHIRTRGTLQFNKT